MRWIGAVCGAVIGGGALLWGGMAAQARPAARVPQPGLCRRPAPLPALAPEPGFAAQGQRGTVTPPPVVSVPVVPMSAPAAPPAPPAPPSAMPAPPPPPPPPAEVAPPSSSTEADSGDLVVTGSRVSPPRGSAFAARRPNGAPPPGLLTAGEHDDLLNPELYARYVKNFLASESLDGVPRVDTARLLTVSVRDGAGRPVPFAPVTLTCADGNRLSLATAADGTARFFPELDRLGRQVTVAVPGAQPRPVALPRDAGGIAQGFTVARAALPVRAFDLALMIDTTGSMGDEISYLQSELRAVIARLARRHPGLSLRVALIAYRDQGDAYVTRTMPFTADLSTFQRRLGAESADGGGDYPEAVERALARAAALDWRPGAVKSLLFVADAPPHAEDVPAAWHAAEVLRHKRVQVVPIAASGVAEGAEYLMRAMAAVTQSRYLFLTDDSGIGNPHAPPAIDCYLVTRLDAAIRRVLDGQLSGRRIEPERGEVIRTVGRPDAGRCILPRGQ